MDNNIENTLKNLLYAFGAQAMSLLLSIVMSLLVPKMLGVEQYSYWQLFLFYSSYVGFLQFGMIDGIYLRLGGKKYEDLDYAIIGSQLKVMVLAQVILAVTVVIFCAFFMANGQRTFVLICTAIYMIIFNIAGFMGYIFQLVNQTKIYSITVIIDKAIFLFLVILLLFCKADSFKIFVIIYIITKICAMGYSLYNGREIVFSELCKSKIIFREIWTNICVGINLTVSNISSMLVLGIGRFIIDKKWGIMAFGKFAFAISLTNFFLTFISQVSMVLFPALRQSDDKQLKKFYVFASNTLGLFSPMIFLAYLPLKTILGVWLPQYQESLKYLGLLLPLCTFDGKMNMLCNTYFKVLRKEKLLLVINVATMLISIILSLIGGFVFNNIYVIIVFTVVSIAFRSVIAEICLAKLMDTKIAFNLLQEVLIAIVFMLSVWYMKPLFAFLVLISIYILYILLNKNRVNETVCMIQSAMNRRKKR